MQLPLHVKKCFWDVDSANIDLQQHQRFIIERVFEYGDLQANKWLLDTFDKKALLQGLQGKSLSLRSRHFWALILKAPQHSALCTKKSSGKQPRTAWNSLHH